MLIPAYSEDYCPVGYIVNKENGLVCKPGFLKLTPEEKSKICNGIGAASGITKHFPSSIWGLDCRECGDIHDYDYHIGGKNNAKTAADRVFLHNLYKKINDGAWALRAIRKARARKYYIALVVGGSAHFNYTK